jgi:hypothetical protein
MNLSSLIKSIVPAQFLTIFTSPEVVDENEAAAKLQIAAAKGNYLEAFNRRRKPNGFRALDEINQELKSTYNQLIATMKAIFDNPTLTLQFKIDAFDEFATMCFRREIKPEDALKFLDKALLDSTLANKFKIAWYDKLVDHEHFVPMRFLAGFKGFSAVNDKYNVLKQHV